MSELLAAAKAVIEWFEYEEPSDLPIEQLMSAVERAEKQEAVGFDAWWSANADSEMAEVAIHKWDECWTAAQQVERERIKGIVGKLSTPKDPWIHYETLLEKIDATTV